MPGKKSKKNAKEVNNTAAAVTDHAQPGKLSLTPVPVLLQTSSPLNAPSGGDTINSNSDSNKSPSPPSSNAPSPPITTPDARPVAPAYNVHPAISPMLDALSTTSVSAGTPPSMTNEWARGGLAGSPNNLIGLMSESPPTQPSSFEDSTRIHLGWAAQRAAFTGSSPASLSPPSSIRRPLSFQMDAHYQPMGTSPQASAQPQRRSSLHSQYSHARTASQPPLPHQPQAHFHGAPDLDLNIAAQAGRKPGDQGFFFGFDTLPYGWGDQAAAENVVIAGHEGGLDVYAIRKKALDPVARLRGLHGGVYHAKILPWTVQSESHASFPLIAVVVHGPVLPAKIPEVAIQDEDPQLDGATSSRPAHMNQDSRARRSDPVIDSYQSAVHIYSLKTNKLIDVLLETPKTTISSAIAITSPVFQPPPPIGALTVKADGGTIAVCSGMTGECWVYLQLLESQNGHSFACVGKLWTCLQQSFRGGDMTEESDKTRPTGLATTPRPSPQTPIVALNGRWIAHCPPAPSSQVALGGQVPVPVLGKAPGVASASPSHLPPVISAVDLPISDSVVNKIMRETTQELIQGAKWVGQQGLQAWNSYWNRPTSPPSQQQARSPPQSWSGSASPRGDAVQFPPTHGASSPAVSKDPGLVSILDAEGLATSAATHPIATFAPPMGCSFLAFSPSGLSLFTASSKGDVQTVWDLFRTQHTKSSPLQAPSPMDNGAGPQVRQIAQFSRMTVARIVDVAWTEPQGERVAMVTERGTIHLLDMPFSSFMWPPPRRRKVAKEGGVVESPENANSAISMASGAFGAAYQAARPFVTRSRRGSNNMPVAASATLRDSAAQGGRFIAASITSSLGKTGTAINQLRYTGENRASLPSSELMPSAGCVTWVRTKKSHVLCAAGRGLVRSFPSGSRSSSMREGKRPGRKSRHRDLNLPPVPDYSLAPAIRQILEHGTEDEIFELSEQELEADNTMTLGHGRAPDQTAKQTLEAAIPQAEIESSSPYQPFHTDRRVALYEYGRDAEAQISVASDYLANVHLDGQSTPNKKKKNRQQPTSESGEPSPARRPNVWAFGQDISVTKRDLGLPAMVDEDLEGLDDHLALPPSAMERVLQYGDEEQIVVTTRRRRGGPRQGDEDEDGFFEDDCEVLDFADQRV